MVKKSEINKKGRLAKSTLSVVLAASMVLTSSSFVWAAPVEDIAVVEEGEAVGAQVIEDVQAAGTDENVGVVNNTCTFPSTTFSLSNSSFVIEQDEDLQDKIQRSFGATTVVRNINGVADLPKSIFQYMEDPAYTVTIKGPDGFYADLTGIKEGDETHKLLPVDIGTYTLTIAGTNVELHGWVANGSTAATFSIVDSLQKSVHVRFKDEGSLVFTGEAIKPAVEYVGINGKELRLDKDYKVLGYGNNTNACLDSDPNAAYVEIQFLGAYAARGTEKHTYTINPAVLDENNTTIKVTNSPAYFNSDVQKPELEVIYNPGNGFEPLTLEAGTDYSAKTRDDAKAIGEYNILIKGVNNFTDNFRVKDGFKIIKGLFNESTIEVKPLTVAFSGEGNPQPADGLVVIDKASGKSLDIADYEILYAQDDTTYSTTAPTTHGTFGIIVKSKNANYNTGEVKSTYIVSNGSSLADYILGKDIEIDDADGIYDYALGGNAPVKLEIGGAVFEPGEKVQGGVANDTYYTVTFPSKEECVNVGTYYITLTGNEGTIYAGQTAQIPFTIVPNDKFDGAESSLVGVHRSSTGELTTSFVQGDYDEEADVYYQLVKGVDYDLICRKVSGEEYEIRVTYKGNYEGSVTFRDLYISKLDLNAENILAEVTGEYTFTGERIKPADANIVLTEVNGDTRTVLRQGIDYKIWDYGTNLEVGKGWVIVGTYGLPGSFYEGGRMIEFDIKAGETVKDNYVLDTKNLKPVYETGTTFSPASDIAVKTTSGKTLATSEYTLKYFRNGQETKDYSSAGTVKMEITIKETQVKLTASYRVATALDKAGVIPATFADENYTGSAIEPKVTITKQNTRIELVKDKDYIVTYSNNINPGTGYITIDGIGDYYGSYSRTFKIVGEMDQEIVVMEAQERDLGNGSRSLDSKATYVKYDVAPKTTVTYTSSDEKVVTIDEKGNIKYTGLGEATITITAAAENGYKAAVKTLAVKVGLAKPSFTPSKSSKVKKGFVVTSNIVKGSEGWEVQYSLKSNLKSSVTKTFADTGARLYRKTITANKSNTIYYVRVRSYATVNGQKSYSAWSEVKPVVSR